MEEWWNDYKPVTAKQLVEQYKVIPESEPKKINVDLWESASSEDLKWELWDGIPFHDDGVERDRLALCLVYSMGLKHFLDILPEKSRKLLKEL